MRLVPTLTCTVLLGLLAATAALAQAVTNHPAMAVLANGINYDWWARRETAAPPLSARQVDELAGAGFRHIRLPLNPRAVGFDYAALSASGCGRGASVLDRFLKETVPALRRADMGLVLTVDATDDRDALQRIAADPSGGGLERLLDCLVRSARAADPAYGPRRIVIGNLNEPRLDPGLWMRLQEGGLGAAAARHPDFYFLATPAFPPNIDPFLRLRPLPRPNIGYEFHFYEPFPFTHQGIPSQLAWLGDKVDVLLPNMPGRERDGACAARLKGVEGSCVACPPDSPDEFCRDWRRTGAPAFGPDYVRRRLGQVRAWAGDRFVYMGEYGVNKGRTPGTGADAASRAWWLRTVTGVAKELGFGRAVFEIGCGMAVSRSTVCSREEFRRLEPLDLDPGIVEALR